MKYHQIITLKDGKECILRNADEADAEAVLKIFTLAHTQTDNLLSYPDEISFTAGEEAAYLKEKTESGREIEILAEINGRVVGTAGIETLGKQEKIRHRCEFGVSIDRAFWGLGVGSALLDACIKCAKDAKYRQMELSVVADNETAVALYRKAGFIEYGRNPRGFLSRTGYQEVVSMLLEL